MSKSNENNPHLIQVWVGTQAATATVPALYARKKMIVRRMTVINGAAIAADNTNFLTVDLKNGSTVLSEVDTRAANEGALTQNVGLEAPEQDLEIAAGATLVVTATKNGTAVPTNMLVQLEVFRV